MNQVARFSSFSPIWSKAPKRFHADEAIVRDVSNIGGGVPGLDLLPSSLGLIKIQDRVTQLTDFEHFSRGPIYGLRDALGDFSHTMTTC